MQLLTSCVDYLDKESDTELTLPMVFEDKTRTEGWLANVYSHVPDPYWGYARKLGWAAMGLESNSDAIGRMDTFYGLGW